MLNLLSCKTLKVLSNGLDHEDGSIMSGFIEVYVRKASDHIALEDHRSLRSGASEAPLILVAVICDMKVFLKGAEGDNIRDTM